MLILQFSDKTLQKLNRYIKCLRKQQRLSSVIADTVGWRFTTEARFTTEGRFTTEAWVRGETAIKTCQNILKQELSENLVL